MKLEWFSKKWGNSHKAINIGQKIFISSIADNFISFKRNKPFLLIKPNLIHCLDYVNIWKEFPDKADLLISFLFWGIFYCNSERKLLVPGSPATIKTQFLSSFIFAKEDKLDITCWNSKWTLATSRVKSSGKFHTIRAAYSALLKILSTTLLSHFQWLWYICLT